MRGPLALSVFLHIAVIVLAWVGLPSFDHRVIDTPPVVDVSLVTDVSQAPEAVRDPMPNPTPKEVVKPQPKQQQASLPKPPPPPPAPPPPPPPAPDAVKAPEEPEPAPKPEPKPEPEPTPKKPEPKKVVEPEVKAPPRPRKKPKPPPEDDFATVLKTVEKLKNKPRPDKPERQQKPEQSFDDAMADVLKKHASAEPPSQQRPVSSLAVGPKMSMSEIDALRRQIERCWSPPAGAPEAENLVVEVQLTINPDGRVQQAQIVDTSRMYRDAYYRAAAESVLRAIKQPACTPLKLPPDKYDLWRETKLTFNPRDLVGR